MSAGFDRPSRGRSSHEQLAYRAGRLFGRLQAQLRRVPVPPPWLVLGLLVIAGWGIAGEAARIAQHDGWLYYQGGDGTWYYTSAWALGNGHLPLASIGYGYPLLIAPFARIAGSSLLDGMPSIVVFNQLVLAPIALVCVYGIVRTVASRWYAYLTSLLWVIAPVLVIHYFLADYHTRYVDQTLPSELGLTARGDFPSLVVLLVSAYFTLRHAATRADVDAVAAGLAAGMAITIKPSNMLFLPAPIAALLVARRPRGLGLFALALAPGLAGLEVWKYRGLGHLSVFSGLHLSWAQLHHNLDGFREYTWSQRMIYFTAAGGLIGLARRSLVAALLAGSWVAAFLIVKGSSNTIGMYQGTFLPHMIAAFPAYFLLVVSVPYLMPVYGSRRPPSPLGPATPRRLPKVACGVLGAILLVGLVGVSVLPKLSPASAAELPAAGLYIPLDGFTVAARTSGGTVTLTWARQQPAGTRATYSILRSPASVHVRKPGTRSAGRTFGMPQIGSVDRNLGRHDTFATSFTDHPPAGAWTYRVALSAPAFGPPTPADYMLISRPVTVTVRARSAGQ